MFFGAIFEVFFKIFCIHLWQLGGGGTGPHYSSLELYIFKHLALQPLTSFSQFSWSSNEIHRPTNLRTIISFTCMKGVSIHQFSNQRICIFWQRYEIRCQRQLMMLHNRWLYPWNIWCFYIRLSMIFKKVLILWYF
jgi:hypothetical protein